MPRRARVHSENGIYHIMLRGINRQNIFEDEEAKIIIQKISKCKTAIDFQNLNIEKRDKYLKLCREKGISIRQLSRLTGVSFNMVRTFR